MNKNRISASMILYNIRGILGNPFIYVFGLGLPIFLSLAMPRAISQGITNRSIIVQIDTTVFLGVGVVIPMATMLIGYAATHSQEMEKEIPLRMRLFGFREKYILLNRMIAETIFLTVEILIYFVCGYIFLELKSTSVYGIFIYLLSLYLLASILFVLAHAIAGLLKKFGPTYAVTMTLYFVMMIFGGLMGIEYDAMPKGMQAVARLLPVTYVRRDFYNVWSLEPYNYVPMIQSYLFLAAVSGILLFCSLFKSKRRQTL